MLTLWFRWMSRINNLLHFKRYKTSGNSLSNSTKAHNANCRSLNILTHQPLGTMWLPCITKYKIKLICTIIICIFRMKICFLTQNKCTKYQREHSLFRKENTKIIIIIHYLWKSSTRDFLPCFTKKKCWYASSLDTAKMNTLMIISVLMTAASIMRVI